MVSLDKEKKKAMFNLITRLRMGYKITKEEFENLDKLKIPMWKQNYLAYVSENTNLYANDIINKLYHMKTPKEFKNETFGIK